jgi:hypothetical protein
MKIRFHKWPQVASWCNTHESKYFGCTKIQCRSMVPFLTYNNCASFPQMWTSFKWNQLQKMLKDTNYHSQLLKLLYWHHERNDRGRVWKISGEDSQCCQDSMWIHTHQMHYQWTICPSPIPK